MNKTYKFVLTLLFVSLILPNLAFASWWNPFSWSIFHKAVKTEVVNVKTPTVTPDIDAIIKAKVDAQVKATLEAKANNDAKIAQQKADEQTKIKNLPTKTDDQICEESFGSNSVYTGQKNNTSPICDCKTNYVFNKENTSCITHNESCAESWTNSGWDGTFTNDGKYNCSCVTGYEWNNDRTLCQIKQTQIQQQSGTLCNGKYWNACPTGQNLICPQSGNAYCQDPQLEQQKNDAINKLESQLQSYQNNITQLNNQITQLDSCISSPPTSLNFQQGQAGLLQQMNLDKCNANVQAASSLQLEIGSIQQAESLIQQRINLLKSQ